MVIHQKDPPVVHVYIVRMTVFPIEGGVLSELSGKTETLSGAGFSSASFSGVDKTSKE